MTRILWKIVSLYWNSETPSKALNWRGFSKVKKSPARVSLVSTKTIELEKLFIQTATRL